MKILVNIINRYQNKKIVALRKELRHRENIILSLKCFINDRNEMDKRNLVRAIEIESVCNNNGKKPIRTYNHTEGLINELKSSIVASETLLNSIDISKNI